VSDLRSQGAARAALLLGAALVVMGAIAVTWVANRGSDTAPGEGAPRVVIVGIDGLDWDILRSAVGEGMMPNVERMMREGASGELRSIPPFVSPSIWTTIATGKREEKHGIHGFLVDRGKTADSTPTSSNMRQAKALWQIATERGLSAGFVSWLVTWPAEAVNGYMVSSNLDQLLAFEDSPAAGTMHGRLAAAAYPSELVDDLPGFRVKPESLPEESVTALLGTTEHLDDPRVAAGVTELRRILAADATVRTLAEHLVRSVPTDVAGAYFRGVDLACHLYWRYREPEEWPGELSLAEREAFGPVVERSYSVADSIVGTMTRAAGPGAVVIVCSDHGFAGHGRRPAEGGAPAMGTAMHRASGIVLMAGPGIRPGAALEGATVLDVTPTVLAILGLPVGRDMDGRVLTEALTEQTLAARPVSFVETYEGGGPSGTSEPVASPVDDEIKERLRSLGYIE